MFYFSTPCYFGHGFTPDTTPVSSLSTRKSFLAKLGGFVAAAGLMPKAMVSQAATSLPPAAPSAAVTPRPETRAVARRPDSV